MSDSNTLIGLGVVGVVAAMIMTDKFSVSDVDVMVGAYSAKKKADTEAKLQTLRTQMDMENIRSKQRSQRNKDYMEMANTSLGLVTKVASKLPSFSPTPTVSYRPISTGLGGR
jgi:hypothetical protein